jgi:hypothetical protein
MPIRLIAVLTFLSRRARSCRNHALHSSLAEEGKGYYAAALKFMARFYLSIT